MKTKIFLSVANGYRKDQKDYESCLRKQIFKLTKQEAVTVSCLCNKGESPLNKVIESIQDCDALIALAFERKHTYLEFIKEKNLYDRIEKKNIYYTSPWIHIECAIAKAFSKPILLLIPSNIESEGVIDSTQDDYDIVHIPTISAGPNNWGYSTIVDFESNANLQCKNTIQKFLADL